MREAVVRLYRPYIPWSVRREVIARQMHERGVEPSSAAKYTGSNERAVRFMIEELFGLGVRVELHHDPALVNREQKTVREMVAIHPGRGPKWRNVVRYTPDANDPDYLLYMPVDDHDVRTRVRGTRGQHSDLALARKRKRVEKKRGTAKRTSKYNRKYNWPSRPLRSASRWPKRSSRL
jgi:hypothetical protein